MIETPNHHLVSYTNHFLEEALLINLVDVSQTYIYLVLFLFISFVPGTLTRDACHAHVTHYSFGQSGMHG